MSVVVSVAIFIMLSLAHDWLRAHMPPPRGRVIVIERPRDDGWRCDVEGGC